MASTFFGLNIARSGMSTYNAWLNTTGHNIANVKTPGYSRQVVNQAATIPISYKTSYGMTGSGVEAVSVTSERDIYYDGKYRKTNSVYGKYETQMYYMQSIETYLYAKDETSGAMTNSLDKFFDLLTGVRTHYISDATARTEAIGYADTLAYHIRETANSLRDMQKDINTEIGATAEKINSYAEQLTYLNKQISTIEVDGTRANDLRDQRAYLLDQLSELIDIDVVEREPVGSMGHEQFIVTVGSAVLVDTFEYNTLQYEVIDTAANQNDINNMYNLKWSNGQDFGIHETGIGGKMQALFELRDGNNKEVFRGEVKEATACEKDADGNITTAATLKVTGTNEIANSLFKLDIPEKDGVIQLGNSRYEYDSFEVTTGVDANGNSVYEYTFSLKGDLDSDTAKGINDQAPKAMQIGDAVDFRGIPYYMSQLNEFIRKFSYEFNKVQVNGYDLNGNPGEEMFLGTDKASGVEMSFGTKDIVENTNNPTLGADNNPVLDANNNQVKQPYEDSRYGNLVGYTFNTADSAKGVFSYYSLTALNTSINSNMVGNGRLLACSDQPGEESNSGNLEKMLGLQFDKTMFHQGEPASFLQVVTTTAGVDAQKVLSAADSAENIRDAIDLRRLSQSGVDEDEEGQNLIICQNLLHYQYKVLSVMNEVLDKLINGTAV